MLGDAAFQYLSESSLINSESLALLRTRVVSRGRRNSILSTFFECRRDTAKGSIF